jgi:hypothetical protein
MGWFDDAGNGSPVDVLALWDSQIPDGIANIVARGALVSVGTTSDGGALGITVTLDGRWRREYFRESEPAVEWLYEAAQAVELERQTASPGPRQRSRRR